MTWEGVIGPVVQGLLRQLRLPLRCYVMFLGAAGTGKTTWFDRFGDIDSNELDKPYVPSTHSNDRSQYVQTSSTEGRQKPMKLVDTPGDAVEYSQQARERKLSDVKPGGIVFLLDHAHPDNPNHGSGRLLSSRIEEHKKSLRELAYVFRQEPKVRSSCKGILIGVNKYDKWQGITNLREFSDSLRAELAELEREVSLSCNVKPMISLSALRGDGEQEIKRFFDSLGLQLSLRRR